MTLFKDVLLTMTLVSLVIHTCSTGDSDRCPAKCTCSSDKRLVDCRGLGLQHIPRLPSTVTTLLLSHNNISQLGRSDFSPGHNLVTLDLSNNQLKELGQNSFVDLKNLRKLYLEDNVLHLNDTKTSLPFGILRPLPSLIELRIHGNIWRHTTEYREDLLRNRSTLQTLSLDSPYGSISLPSAFSDMRMLRKLTIYGGISDIGNNTLSALNTTLLEEISFSGGNLKSVDVLAFSLLTKMTLLDLSNNEGLGFGEALYQAWYGLTKTHIRKLYLRNICVYDTLHPTPPITQEFFNYLNETTLVELYLDNNGLTMINAEFHKVLPRLEKLSLWYNSFFAYILKLFEDLVHMDNLTYIDVSQQAEFPEPMKRNTLQLQTPHILYVEFPPKLKTLNTSRGLSILPMQISTFLIRTNSTYMDVVDMSQNAIGSITEGVLLSPPHILYVGYFNMSVCNLNYMQFSQPAGQSQLRVDTWDLTDNNLGSQYMYDLQGTTLASTTMPARTREIFLSGNGIKSLPFGFFNKTITLERIHLRSNALRTWNCSMSSMPNFTFLDLSYNLLSSLPPERIAELDTMSKTRTISIDLMGNPLICDCFTLYFLRWLNKTNVNISNLANYTCVMNNTDVRMDKLKDIIHSLNIHCSSKLWAIVTGTLFAVAILLMFVSVIVYRHRWDIKYVCVRLVRRRRAEQQQNDAENYAFDAFVAYHNKDLSWIEHSLMVHLESGQDPFRLCVHHRNWLPGPTIEENISWSVESSRKTLVILSSHFVRSGWCELEMQLARMKGLEEGQNVIIVIALEEIPTSELNRTLVNLRRTNTWLDWYKYETDREHFWEQLVEALTCGRSRSNRRITSQSTESMHVSEDVPLIN